jgi:colanic acid/amylovoran biosynthesis glycosyltransferase
MAMKELKKQGINFKWNIIGEGPQREELMYSINALGLKDNIELCGSKNRDEILKHYETSDAFLLTSVYEGIANVCLEAMAMELPVVSTKSGGMEEVIDHGENGLLCEVFDSADIVDKLQIIMADHSLRKKFGINARKTVEDSLTLQSQTDVFEEQYFSLVNN